MPADLPIANPALPPKLRVAMVNQDLWMGGGTVFTLNLGGEFRRRGVETQVFSFGGPHSLEKDFVREKLPVHRLRRAGLIFEDRLAFLLNDLREYAPNVVIANESFDTCELMRYLPVGVQRIAVVHTALPATRESVLRYVPWLDRVVTVSLAVRDQLLATPDLPGGIVTGIELGVPMPATPVARDLAAGKPLRILYLGRLEDAAKRVRIFPAIFKKLCADGVPFIWTIAGMGPEREWLERELTPRPPDHLVRFTGLVPHGEVGELLAANDVVLLTSDSEAFPLSLHEGMAAGLVPVTSDLPGRVREIVTPETGCLVPIDQIEGYAAAIRWLHEHRLEMSRMSQAAREMIGGHYTVEAMADRWLELLGPLVPLQAPVWPGTWEIRPPVGRQGSRRFHKQWRPFRRLGARLRHSLQGR